MLCGALAASIAVACVEEHLPALFQLEAVAALLPYFILGMLARRICSRLTLAESHKGAANAPLRALAFVGRNAWAIMFLDSFFKAVLMVLMPQRSMALPVICLDLLLSAIACKCLTYLPGHRFLGVSD